MKTRVHAACVNLLSLISVTLLVLVTAVGYADAAVSENKVLGELNGLPTNCTEKTNNGEWILVWSDEFDKAGAPDRTKWKFETGGGGWGNDEDEFYTNRRRNSRVENGHLIIEAHMEKQGSREFTSARLNSKKSWTYGRFEFRAKLPRGRGTWPAAWLLASQQTYGDQFWPDNGEIDVLEAIGHEQNVNHVSTHTKDYNFIIQTQNTAVREIPDADTKFHTYAVEWLPDSIQFYVGRKKYMTVKKQPGDDWKKWPFDHDFYIILNLAVGGHWGRANGIDENAFPARFEIDYVRVYQPSAEACGNGSPRSE